MGIKNENNQYISPPGLGEFQYEYDYYSGSQINIMIGDVLIDTCVGIMFNVSQGKKPVYGYANQYYSYVADGSVIVQGQLYINFKESGYLLWPIQRFLNRIALSRTTSPRYLETTGSVDGEETTVLGRGFKNANSTNLASFSNKARKRNTMLANVEQMMEWNAESGPNAPRAVDSEYNKFVTQLGSLDDKQFEDWAEAFEDVVWYGSDTTSLNARDSMNSKNLSDEDFTALGHQNRAKLKDDLILAHRRADQYPEIDIFITYGDTNRQSTNHTVKKLVDVSFIGQGQNIQISGQPQLESYTFIAKNLI